MPLPQPMWRAPPWARPWRPSAMTSRAQLQACERPEQADDGRACRANRNRTLCAALRQPWETQSLSPSLRRTTRSACPGAARGSADAACVAAAAQPDPSAPLWPLTRALRRYLDEAIKEVGAAKRLAARPPGLAARADKPDQPFWAHTRARRLARVCSRAASPWARCWWWTARLWDGAPRARARSSCGCGALGALPSPARGG